MFLSFISISPLVPCVLHAQVLLQELAEQREAKNPRIEIPKILDSNLPYKETQLRLSQTCSDCPHEAEAEHLCLLFG